MIFILIIVPTGSNTLNMAIEIQKQLTEMLSSAGFN